MGPVCSIPCRPAIVGDVVVVENGTVVVGTSRLVGNKSDDGTLFDKDSVRVIFLVWVVGEVQLGSGNDSRVDGPVIPIRTRSIPVTLEHPHLVGGVVTVLAEDVHVRKARRLEVLVLVSGVKLGELHAGTDLALGATAIHKVQACHGRIRFTVFRKVAAFVRAAVIGIDNLQITAGVSIGHFEVRVVLHGEMRVQRVTRHELQCGRGGVERERHRRALGRVLLDHHGVELLGLAALVALKRGQGHADLGFVRRVLIGLDGVGRLLELVARRDLGGHLAVRDVEGLAVVDELELERGDADHALGVAVLDVSLGSLIRRSAHVEGGRVHRKTVGLGSVV